MKSTHVYKKTCATWNEYQCLGGRSREALRLALVTKSFYGGNDERKRNRRKAGRWTPLDSSMRLEAAYKYIYGDVCNHGGRANLGWSQLEGIVQSSFSKKREQSALRNRESRGMHVYDLVPLETVNIYI
jgi:hypothetical protein